jgi:hypothetical protein
VLCGADQLGLDRHAFAPGWSAKPPRLKRFSGMERGGMFPVGRLLTPVTAYRKTHGRVMRLNMKGFRRDLLFHALVACTALLSACSNPGYNDNPSQQITNARVGCLAATDFLAVYFSVHVQPARVSPDARVTREMFRSYCEELPAPGKVFLTVDLVGPELKRIPLGIRIVEPGLDDGESPIENATGARTISEVPARTYPNGIIESQFNLDKNGSYAIYLMRAGDDAVAADNTLKIPLHVGVDTAAGSWRIRLIALFGLALISFLAFRYWRGRKT